MLSTLRLPEDAASMSKEPERFQAEARYLHHHLGELRRKYPERWVGVFQEQVVAVADNPKQLMQQLHDRGIAPSRVYRVRLSGGADPARST